MFFSRFRDCCEAIKLVASAAEIFMNRSLAWRDRSIKRIDKALEIAPRFYLAWFMRGVIVARVALYKKSREMVWEAVENFNRAYDPEASRNWPHKYRPFLAKGKLFYRFAMYEDALREFSRAIELADDVDPNEIFLRKSLALYNLGRFRECVEVAMPTLKPIHDDELIRLAGEHANLYRLSEEEAKAVACKAISEILIRYLDEAEKTVEWMLSRAETPEALALQVSVLQARGDRNYAMQVFSRIPEGERPIEALLAVWRLYKGEGDYVSALRFIEEALDRIPNSIGLRWLRCDTLLRIKGRSREAEECYRDLVEDCGGRRYFFCQMAAYDLAVRLMREGRFEEAEKYFKLAMEMMQYPHSDTYFHYAYMLEKIPGRLDEALEYYKLAARYGEFPLRFGSCASVFEDYGLYKEALVNYFKAITEQIGSGPMHPLFRKKDWGGLKAMIKIIRRSGGDCCDVIEMIGL